MTSLADTAPDCSFMKSCTESSVDAASPLGSGSSEGARRLAKAWSTSLCDAPGPACPAAGEASCSRNSR